MFDVILNKICHSELKYVILSAAKNPDPSHSLSGGGFFGRFTPSE
jgi:hypothetical protein